MSTWLSKAHSRRLWTWPLAGPWTMSSKCEEDGHGGACSTARILYLCLDDAPYLWTGTHRQRKGCYKGLWKKAFLLNDRSITTTSPAYTALVQSLKDTGIDGVPYPTAHADTPETIVAQGVQDLKEEGCDMIIALGQSAIMDCAKQIAYEVSRQAHPVVPLFFVPTTFDCVSAFTNAFTFHGNTVWHPQLQAKAAIADPDLMKTMKDDVKPYAAFMAFCRCLSACVDPQAEPLTTALALYGLKVLYQHSRKGLLPDAAGSDWEQVALAGITASLISSTASTTLIDGLERVVTERRILMGPILPVLSCRRSCEPF